MKLSKQTDFAFRTLLYLGQQPQGKLVNIQQVCDFYDISSNHIAKVVMRLVHLGYVDAVRGKGGGIRLGCRAEDVSLVNVVREFETTLQPINCAEQPCRIIQGCKLKGLLAKAVSAFLATLEPYSLADLLYNETTRINFIGEA